MDRAGGKAGAAVLSRSAPTLLGVTRQVLSEDERRTLWEQFTEVHAESQEAFDTSVRTLAAAGVAVTVSLATALKGLDGTGTAAVAAFVVSLSLNLLSFLTAQLDVRGRLASLRRGEAAGVDGNAWTVVTTILNLGAGAALILGAVLLTLFVADAA